MGVLLIALVLSVATSLAVTWVAYRIGLSMRQPRIARAVGILWLVLTPWVLLVPFAFWLDRQTTFENLNANGEAIRSFIGDDLPAHAAHSGKLQVRAATRTKQIEFTIAEEDFLRWMRGRGYEPQSFEGGNSIRITADDSNSIELVPPIVYRLPKEEKQLGYRVQRGYIAKRQIGSWYEVTVYDSDTQRVYVREGSL